ncbi:MAG: murein biosynthesis integral membrane protein MurJ [Gammaproteobacteria bacterium]
MRDASVQPPTATKARKIFIAAIFACGRKHRAAAFAGELLFLLATGLSVLSAAVMLAAPQVIAVLAPGLKEAALAADLLRIVFPYIALISLVALFAGMLNAGGHFRAAAAAPLLLNIALIAAALLFAPAFMPPITALAWGVLAGGALQLLLVGFCARRAGLRLRIRPRPPDARMRNALRLIALSALGAGAVQINLLINLAVASLLAAGSISWLYYADRLMELPAGLLGAALATVALPALAQSDPRRASEILDHVLRLALLLSAPAAAGMAILAEPAVNVLFLRGAFRAEDAVQTARAAAAYSAGVVGLTALRPLAAAFFARKDAAAPAKTALAALVITQLFNLLFVFTLDWGHSGIALSIGLAATFNAGALLWILRRRKWYLPQPGWTRLFAALIAALGAMSAVLWAALPEAEFWSGDWSARAAALGGLVLLGAAVYFAALRLGGIRLADFRRAETP